MSIGDPIEIGGARYSIERLSAFDQLHVATSLQSPLTWLAVLAKTAREEQKEPPGEAQFVKSMVSLMDGLSPEARDSAVRCCLGAVTRESGGAWARFMAPSGKPMFEDVDLREMMLLTYHVVQRNGLVDFFDASPAEPRAGTALR
jgi:hypothetical protein